MQQQARREAAIKAEMDRILVNKEATARVGSSSATSMTGVSEERVQEIVRGEVEKLKQFIKEAVSDYCKSVFDTQQDNDFTHIVAEGIHSHMISDTFIAPPPSPRSM